MVVVCSLYSMVQLRCMRHGLGSIHHVHWTFWTSPLNGVDPQLSAIALCCGAFLHGKSLRQGQVISSLGVSNFCRHVLMSDSGNLRLSAAGSDPAYASYLYGRAQAMYTFATSYQASYANNTQACIKVHAVSSLPCFKP